MHINVAILGKTFPENGINSAADVAPSKLNKKLQSSNTPTQNGMIFSLFIEINEWNQLIRLTWNHFETGTGEFCGKMICKRMHKRSITERTNLIGMSAIDFTTKKLALTHTEFFGESQI